MAQVAGTPYIVDSCIRGNVSGKNEAASSVPPLAHTHRPGPAPTIQQRRRGTAPLLPSTPRPRAVSVLPRGGRTRHFFVRRTARRRSGADRRAEAHFPTPRPARGGRPFSAPRPRRPGTRSTLAGTARTGSRCTEGGRPRAGCRRGPDVSEEEQGPTYPFIWEVVA